MNQTILAFGYPENVIKEHNHWIVLLRPKQVTIGSLVLAAKSDATALGDLNAEVWSEYALVTREIEELLRKTYKADKFNYLALMMKDPNVHFHFIPRYSQPVKIGDQQFADRDWPLKTELEPIDLSEAQFAEIQHHLKVGLA